MTRIVELSRKKFFAKWKENRGGFLWYLPLIRMYRYEDIIYEREDALYIFPGSRNKLIQHEEGHISGLGHTWCGLMSWHGLERM
jgi:hypothetical protein